MNQALTDVYDVSMNEKKISALGSLNPSEMRKTIKIIRKEIDKF